MTAVELTMTERADIVWVLRNYVRHASELRSVNVPALDPLLALAERLAYVA